MLLHEDMAAEADSSYFSKLYGPLQGAISNAGEEVRPKGDATAFTLPKDLALPAYYRVETIEEPNGGFVWAGQSHSNFVYKIPDQLTWIIEVRERRSFFGRVVPGKFGRRKSLLERLLEKIFN